MGYATAEDMQSRFSERILAHVTDPAGKVVQVEALEAALLDAGGLVDAYLARYELPLPSVPVALRLHCCNIALYQLLSLRPAGDVDDARQRFQDALRFLEGVSAGRIDLGTGTTGSKVAEGAGAIYQAADRVFTRESLADF